MRTLLLALTLSLNIFAAEPTLEECAAKDWSTPECEKIEHKANHDIQTICKAAPEKMQSIESLQADLAQYKDDPSYRQNVKRNVSSCVNSQRLFLAAAAKAAGK